MSNSNTLAFISDLHGNAVALRAVLTDLQERGAARIYCLGDLVGYGPNPNGVIDLVRETGIPTVAGNYDDGVGFNRGHCGCWYPNEEAELIGTASYGFTASEVTDDRKKWLRELPFSLQVSAGNKSMLLVHGSPRRINEYLLPERAPRTYERLAAEIQDDTLIFGHTHTPWSGKFKGVRFINVPSLGRPKDGDPRAAYTLHHPARDPWQTTSCLKVCPLHWQKASAAVSEVRYGPNPNGSESYWKPNVIRVPSDQGSCLDTAFQPSDSAGRQVRPEVY